MMVIVAGLPATGKSTLARALAASLDAVVLDKDAIRAALFPEACIEYSAEQDDFCQNVMLDTAAYLLRRRPSLIVFLDGRTFSRAYQRENAQAAAARLGVPAAVVECVCAEQTALARLERDLAAGTHPARNRTPELYRRLRDTFEPIPDPKLVVDTGRPLDDNVARAAAYLRSLS